MSSRIPKLTVYLLVLTLAVSMLLIPSGAAPSANAGMGDVTTATDSAAYKIHAKLQAAVAAAEPSQVLDVMVYARQGTDLSKYLRNVLVRPYVMPNGTQATFGQITAAQVSKLASLSEVAAVQEMKFPGDLPILPEGPAKRINTDPDALKARLAELRAGREIATVTQPEGVAKVADWFDILDVHKSKAAWDLGFTGDGVKVMVNDSGIDFAHPDLQGMQARITDPASPYYGWPVAFDSISMLALAYDYYLGIGFIKNGVGVTGAAPDYADTSTTRSGADLADHGDGTFSTTFTPLASNDPAGHTYRIPATSKSGVYHFGSHPDTALLNYGVFDERWAVLVTDEAVAGVYDTVYTDLLGDYDFTNDKPARLGDEAMYLDLDGDGYADLSGGSIYWISDGANPLPASDWLWGIGADVAGPGDLVAFTVMDFSEGGGDHGQLCASAVAAQGIIDGGAPAIKPVGDGTPNTGLVNGGGKSVGLVAAGNHYQSVDDNEGYLFAALGYDGFPGTEDDIQIISNSWGYSATTNDGWDYTSRSIDTILRWVNPTLSDMNSTGNGAAGYGTVTSPGETLSVSVGASTLYDTGNNFDLPVTLDQLTYNDLMSWSNRGPTAMGDNGVSVLANGAWGAGDLAVNEVFDGWNAWEIWGGTSRSAPIAAGNLALVYGAFKDAYGRWPTNVEARAILMSGADDAGNDGLAQGAGTVNALRSVQIAAGLDGVSVLPDSWAFGDYRGTEYEAFSKIVHPGDTAVKEFTLTNAGATDETVTISDEWLVKIGSKEWDFTTADRTVETKNFYLPDYVWDITDMIPAGTDLMEVKLVHPFSEFDPDGNYTANSTWRIIPMDWTDLNGDGILWTDADANTAVNCPIVSGLPNYADAACEIQLELNRFGYGYDQGTALQQRVKNPLERMHDGIVVAVQHRTHSALVPITHLKLQVNFYELADFPWLTTDASVTVPAGGSATFNATMAIPPLAGMGLYEGFIRVSDGANVSNVPVVANVAAWSTDFLFGGPPDSTSPYDNGQVFGYFDWSWRAESGDWRFYFVDVPDSTAAGTSFLVDTRWTGAYSDIDTLVMGPTADCFSNGVGCEWPFEIFPGAEDVYGPYSLYPVGGSSRWNISAGKWLWDTSTGTTREIVAAPATPGLNLIALHNVMYDGSQPEERFQGQAGTITAMPDAVDLFVGSATSGTLPMSIKSSLALVGLEAEGFGLGVPETQSGLPQIQDDPDDPSTASYRFPISIAHAASLEVTTESAAGDLDLFLLYDRNGDGTFDFNTERVGSSTTSTANEQIRVVMPPDGEYLAAVHGWSAAAAAFSITINAVQGYDLAISGLPSGPYQPNAPIDFNLDWTLSAPLAPGEEASGLILAGPPGAPSALQIPVRLHNITTGMETKTIAASQDTFLQAGTPTSNFGAWSHLYVGGADSERTVVGFDLSAIPAANPVLSAKLQVYADAYSGGGTTADLAAYKLTTAWHEATATWKTPWATAGGDFCSASVTAPIKKSELPVWKEFDITPWVQSWVADPATNHGVMLRLINETSYTIFRLASSEHWEPALAPTLTVTYGVP